jgi:P-type Cu+ transporter
MKTKKRKLEGMSGGYFLVCLLFSALLLFLPGGISGFFATAAAIITLGLLGYCLRGALVRMAKKEMDRLTGSQKIMANMIAYDDRHEEQVFPIEQTQLRSGDLLLIQPGEQVPADCKILWGEAVVNEAVITGESGPLNRGPKDILTGGSFLVSGTVRVQVMAAGEASVLALRIQILKKAQGEKVPLQQLAERISKVFIPAAGAIALFSFLVNYWFLHELSSSLMRGLSVLLITCPFAMGLATPTAITIGLSRAAGLGILFRHATCLSCLKDIRQVVFNKTGTLTTGDFAISDWGMNETAKAILPETLPEGTFKSVVCSLEKYSHHPIGQSIAREWKTKSDLRWARIAEVKGLGIRGETKSGDIYWAASHKIFENRSLPMFKNAPGTINPEQTHDVYIIRNDGPIGWIDVTDMVRPEAEGVVRWFHTNGIRTVLLSGARLADCQRLAARLAIEEVQAEQSPEDKLATISRFSKEGPVVMVGDGLVGDGGGGINNAPANAIVSISMCEASRLAEQTADIILLNQGQGLKHLPAAISLGRLTFGIMRQNLYWVFFYNIIAIPVAAAGLIHPVQAALVMGCSYLVPIFNTMRLHAVFNQKAGRV